MKRTMTVKLAELEQYINGRERIVQAESYRLAYNDAPLIDHTTSLARLAELAWLRSYFKLPMPQLSRYQGSVE